jgi:hypothetical protein
MGSSWLAALMFWYGALRRRDLGGSSNSAELLLRLFLKKKNAVFKVLTALSKISFQRRCRDQQLHEVKEKPRVRTVCTFGYWIYVCERVRVNANSLKQWFGSGSRSGSRNFAESEYGSESDYWFESEYGSEYGVMQLLNTGPIWNQTKDVKGSGEASSTTDSSANVKFLYSLLFGGTILV